MVRGVGGKLIDDVGNGQQGFQEPIQPDSLIVDGMGALGTAHSERGLTYFEVALSGHMCVPPVLPCPSLVSLLTMCCAVSQGAAVLPEGESFFGLSLCRTGDAEGGFVRRLRSTSWST